MKRMIRTLALALVATVSFSAANAQKFQSYSISQEGSMVTITGYVTGLGNVTKFGGNVSVSFDYTIDGSCENKNGHEISSFTCSGNGIGNYSVIADKNGRYYFNETIDMSVYLENSDCRKNLCPNGLVGGATYTLSNLAIVSTKKH